MHLNDLKIATQLRFGLGAILALMIAVGVMASLQKDVLWLQTQTLYDHPLTVTRAIGALTVDTEIMTRHMLDLIRANNDQEFVSSLQDIELAKANAGRQFAILEDRYLGPKDDITHLNDAFVKWNVLRDETIRLIKAGKTDEASGRIQKGGVQTAQADLVRQELQTITAFANNKSNELYQTAREQKNALNRWLTYSYCLILLLTLTVTWHLVKSIKTPLAELLTATDQFRQGKMDRRSGYVSANEFGTMSAAFNAMADSLQTEMQISEKAAQLAGAMLREEEIHAFCRELLKGLLAHTGSQVGAVYFLNEARTAFDHFESIGLNAGGRAAFSATDLQGELGAVAATRQIQRITEIPADTRFTFTAVSGTFTPREILTIPVLSDHTVTAVISLASVRSYDAASLRLVNDIWSVLSARVNGVLAFQKVKTITERLEQQNRELAEQKRELETQSDALTEQNAELAMQKRQLDEANRLKSAFLSNMSHELRTPLNSVIALSGVLSRRLANAIPAEEYGYLAIIERNGKSLLALINDILDLSRIESGHAPLSVSRFSLRALAAEIVAVLEPQAREKGIALVSRLGDDLPLLTSDSDKCRHILQNLAGNAVKFTETGFVELSARRESDDLLVTVRDTGIGIAAHQLPHIFDQFRQADESTSRKYGGTGLGLAIAKEYARLIGGSITVESTPGKGSAFTLRIPLALDVPESAPAEEPEQQAATPAAGTGPLPAGQGQTLLLVEDNDAAIIQLTDLLHRQGYHVRTARNGREALAQISSGPPDAMILDLMMPEVDGFQVLKAIRNVESTASLPVLILTAKIVSPEELSFLKGNHIHQLIQKGDINKAGLLAAVARMVAPPRAEPAPPRRNPPTRPGKPVVLVVEDNPDNMRTARALLEERYQVIEAEDGRAGVELARLKRPDIILSDIALPVMDGFAALAAIRKDESLRHIPVIAVTASAMKGSREEILARGFDGYISKPIDHAVLMKTLEEFLT